MVNAIFRLPQVKASSGLARSTVYLRVSQGLFTRPIQLGGRSVGWPANEIDALNSARISGLTDDEIRSLVRRLESQRKSSWKRFGNE
jgi:prophage regulatory protein